jgi:hypothetical protein
MKKLLLTAITFIVGTIALGQNSVNAVGGDVYNNTGSVSFSIGQVAIENTINTTGSISQGVQQAFEITTLNLDENKLNLSLSAYPNPTQTQLILHIGNYNQEKLKYNIVSSEGKLLSQGNIQTIETIIDLQQIPKAIYFIEVQEESTKIQTFRIIKN